MIFSWPYELCFKRYPQQCRNLHHDDNNAYHEDGNKTNLEVKWMCKTAKNRILKTEYDFSMK